MKKLLKKLLKEIEKLLLKLTEDEAVTEATEAVTEAIEAHTEAPEMITEPVATTPTATPSEEPIQPIQLDWCYGGFNGSKATQINNAKIGNLKVTTSGLSYKWLDGGCEQLGATAKNDYSATIACLFCLIDGKWKGGKFDWISTDRTTRSFSNIYDGYNGWDKGAIQKAKGYAFVIVSKDGKHRTNIARAE